MIHTSIHWKKKHQIKQVKRISIEMKSYYGTMKATVFIRQ